jgi:hypothetical protein
MEEIELKEMLEGAHFRFAKSMPHLPHWYTLRETWKNETDFVDAVKKIRECGEMRAFGKRNFIYYDIGEFTYWTMGDSLDNTILINRAKLQ